jgi:hypothetical protein
LVSVNERENLIHADIVKVNYDTIHTVQFPC